MIQRQQTLWLLLAAICSFLSFQFNFYSGQRVEIAANGPMFEELNAGSNFFLLILTGISVLLSVIAIFLFKDRKMQLKMAIGGIVLAVILLIIYFVEVKKFQTGNFALTCIFSFAVLAGYAMAARGIWKDEKLVKSLNKLR
jgi:drug/metabolite transporter (DMT)-like permease